MRVDIISIFPEVFDVAASTSMLGIARERGLLDLRVHDLRDWSEGRHRQVDDEPYGGGPGMVMKPEPFFRAVEAVVGDDREASTVVLLCPQGRLLDQSLVEDLAARERLVLLCGRYEGFDERVRTLADLQVSIGDYVLTGGELAAMVVIDAVCRLIPGALGSEESPLEESHACGLLEYAQYTRPPEYRGWGVPEILLSGNHAQIARWRREQALKRTAQKRPDLLEKAKLCLEDKQFLEKMVHSSGDCAII